MSFFRWIFSCITDLLLGSAQERRANSIAAEREAGTFRQGFSDSCRDFDADYKAAIRLLRDRIDRKFPNGHYAKLRSGLSTPGDDGEDRARAIDTVSIAIASALRDGATVQQASDIGAASVGI